MKELEMSATSNKTNKNIQKKGKKQEETLKLATNNLVADCWGKDILDFAHVDAVRIVIIIFLKHLSSEPTVQQWIQQSQLVLSWKKTIDVHVHSIILSAPFTMFLHQAGDRW